MSETRDDRIVRGYLEALSGLDPERPLPSADAVWERARVARRIERRRALVRRAVRPVAWIERGLGLAAAAAVGWWTWWRWDLVVEGSERLVDGAATTDVWTLLGLAVSLTVVVVIAADRAAAALRDA